MQPPPQAGRGHELTWGARVWLARSPDGRSTAEPVSLSQLARAFARGQVPPECEVAREGDPAWENIRAVLARYAELAPPHSHDSGRFSDSIPQLELTLTVQKDSLTGSAPVPQLAPDASPLPSFPLSSAELPASMGSPPLPTFGRPVEVPTFPPAAPATAAEGDLFDFTFATPLPARLAPLIHGAGVLVGGLTLAAALILGITSMVEQLGQADDARTVVLALLEGLAFIVGGVAVAGSILVLGRALAGLVVTARRIEEALRNRR